MAGDARYRSLPTDAVTMQDLGAVVALYHRRSGQTHLLASPVPEILAVLAALGEGGAADVAGALAERFDLDAEGDSRAVIADRLGELAALGLVAPA